METMAKVKRICNKRSFNTAWKHHVQIYMHVFLMRDEKEERKKEASMHDTYIFELKLHSQKETGTRYILIYMCSGMCVCHQC